MGFHEVFGIRETKVEVKEEVPMEVVTNSHPSMSHILKGERLTGKYFAESIEPLPESKSQVLANLADGTPCLIASS